MQFEPDTHCLNLYRIRQTLLVEQIFEYYFPILLLIRNDPWAKSVCYRNRIHPLIPQHDGTNIPEAGDILSEILAPIRALLNARTARGRLAEKDAARSVEALDGAVIEIALTAVMSSKPASERGKKQVEQIKKKMIEPPLGWSLSDEVRTAMNQTYYNKSGGLETEFQMLEAVLNYNLAGYQKCNAY